MEEILFCLLEQPTKTETEKVYEGNVQVHERLLKRFIAFDVANEKDVTPTIMDYLIKLAGAIGYSQQVHAGLVKTYQHEKRLKDIESKLAKLPPEIKEKLIDSGN